MKPSKEPKFFWDEETGTATCVLDTKEKSFMTTATCHPQDRDFCSEKTGMAIAESRMIIKVWESYRDVSKNKLDALKQLYYSINCSKKFNPNSYENKMLQRQIKICTEDLVTAKNMISTEKKKLITYIAEKEKFYVHIRANREKANKAENK